MNIQLLRVGGGLPSWKTRFQCGNKRKGSEIKNHSENSFGFEMHFILSITKKIMNIKFFM